MRWSPLNGVLYLSSKSILNSCNFLFSHSYDNSFLLVGAAPIACLCQILKCVCVRAFCSLYCSAMQSSLLKLLLIEHPKALALETEHPNEIQKWVYSLTPFSRISDVIFCNTFKMYSVFVSFLYYWKEQKLLFTQQKLWFHYFKNWNSSLLCSGAGLNLY